jgi:uncharacterized cupredoxin-like copper-binding protein
VRIATLATGSAAAAALALGGGVGVPAAAASPSSPFVIHVDLAKSSPFALTPTLHRSPSGRVTFAVKNDGTLKHELVVIKLRNGEASLPVQGARVSEKGWAGETGDLAPGATKKVTLTLSPGRYALVCNLPGHYAAGMHSTFTVS